MSIFGFGNPPKRFVDVEDRHKSVLFKVIILQTVVLVFAVAYSFFDLKSKIKVAQGELSTKSEALSKSLEAIATRDETIDNKNELIQKTKRQLTEQEQVLIEGTAAMADFVQYALAINSQKAVPKCAELGNAWINLGLKEQISIEQLGCKYSGHLDTEGFSHTISGFFTSEDRATLNIKRINKVNNCTTSMHGTVLVEGQSSIRRTILGTDGDCDLPKTFANSFLYEKK